MKVLTWNLKLWPGFELSVDEDKGSMDAEAVDALSGVKAVPDEAVWSRNEATRVDYYRIEKFIEVLSKKEDFDVIFLQEIVSKAFVNYAFSEINKKKGTPVYKSIVHFNDKLLAQGLSIISKHPVIEVEKIDVGMWLKDYPRINNMFSELAAKTLNFEKFMYPDGRPEFQRAVGSNLAYGVISNNSSAFATGERYAGLRPILAAKIQVDSKPVWCVNLHLKSRLLKHDALSLRGGINYPAELTEILHALNKTLREIYAYAVVGFTNSKVAESGSGEKLSFIVAGDYNTIKNTDAPGVDVSIAGDSTLAILMNPEHGKYKYCENTAPTINDFVDPSKSATIDHILYRAEEGSYLSDKNPSPVEIINSKEETFSYDIIDKEYTGEVKKGKYYIISEEMFSKSGKEGLYIALSDVLTSTKTMILKDGTKVFSGAEAKEYTLGPGNDAKNRMVTIISSNENVYFSLPSGCIIKSLRENRSGTVKSLGLSTTTFYIKETQASTDTELRPEGDVTTIKNNFVVKEEEWKEVYTTFRKNRTYWVNSKMVQKDPASKEIVLYQCKITHRPEEIQGDATDPEYIENYWTKIGPLRYGYISDHNGVMVSFK